MNEKIAQKLAETGNLKLVAVFFLLGAAAQVVGAFLNKTANWYVYMSEAVATFRPLWQTRLARWYVEQFWIDIVLDVGSMLLFGLAAWRLLTVFAK